MNPVRQFEPTSLELYGNGIFGVITLGQ